MSPTLVACAHAAIVVLDRAPIASPPPGQLGIPSPPPAANPMHPPATFGALPSEARRCSTCASI